MTTSAMTYSNVQIHPFKLTSLQELKVIKTVNDHTRVTFTGIIPEDRKDSYAKMADDQTDVKILLKYENGAFKTWFHGIILRARVKLVRGIYYLKVEACSHSYRLDVKRHYRSFQNPAMPYSQLVDMIVSDYEGADVIDNVSNGTQLRKFIMQYEETDWQFLKRMASHFHTSVIPASNLEHPKLYFGLPQGRKKIKVQAAQYTVDKRVAEYYSAQEHRIPNAHEQDYLVYEVQSEQLLDLGEEVEFRSQSFFVGHAVTEMKDSLLIHTYQFYPRPGLRKKKIYNNAIIGASIQGRVLQIKGDRIRAKLDMDDQQDASTAYWFPYSTIYASENNTGWYCMPELNDQIRIYFPSNKEQEGIAISSVKRTPPAPSANSQPTPRQSSSASSHTSSTNAAPEPDRYEDPNIKTLRTASGKEIKLAPDRIVISSGGMTITLSDADGIQISSDKSVIVSANESLEMYGKNIKISGETVFISGKSNSVDLKDSIVIKGSDVKMN